ncbi:MAG: hypothetical protein WCR72_17415 [Bacteroidota bacterium]
MLKKFLLFLYLIILTFLSLLPPQNLPHAALFPNADKLIHCCLYAGFTFLLFWGWHDKFIGKKQLLPLLAVFVWGMVMEIIQGVGHYGRSFEFTDEIANIAGFFPGWVAWLWIRKYTKASEQIH